MHRLLLIDDEMNLLEVLGTELEAHGYHVTKAFQGATALELLLSQPFDLVITDLFIDAVTGLEVLEKAKALNHHTIVIIMTGSPDVAFAVKALRSGADDYILKPFRISELRERLAIHFESLALSGQGVRSRPDRAILEKLGDLYKKTEALTSLMERLLGSGTAGLAREVKGDDAAPMLNRPSRASICESMRGRRAFWGKRLLSKLARVSVNLCPGVRSAMR